MLDSISLLMIYNDNKQKEKKKKKKHMKRLENFWKLKFCRLWCRTHQEHLSFLCLCFLTKKASYRWTFFFFCIENNFILSGKTRYQGQKVSGSTASAVGSQIMKVCDLLTFFLVQSWISLDRIVPLKIRVSFLPLLT